MTELVRTFAAFDIEIREGRLGAESLKNRREIEMSFDLYSESLNTRIFG